MRGDLSLDRLFVTTDRESRVTGYGFSYSQPADPQPRFPGFVFVQTEEEKAKICSHVNSGLSIVALDVSQ